MKLFFDFWFNFFYKLLFNIKGRETIVGKDTSFNSMIDDIK